MSQLADLDETVICQICGQTKDLDEVWPAELIRNGVQEAIRKEHQDWTGEGYICVTDLNYFRHEYVEAVLEEEAGQINSLQEEVLKSLKEHEVLSRNINLESSRT